MKAKADSIDMSPLVVIVDDDESMRDSMADVFRSIGTETATFKSIPELLAANLPDRPGCLVLDVRLPGMSGLEFQASLAGSNVELPIVFVTGYGDVPMTVKAMKAGAVDFLQKPFRDQDILDAVSSAVEKDRIRRAGQAATDEISALASMLSPREHQVMQAVVEGNLNKQIAFQLGLSEITVKIHRGNVMRKMKAASVPELVRKTEILKGVRQHARTDTDAPAN